MTPADGEAVEVNAPASDSMTQTSSSDDVQPDAQANGTPAAPESTELSPSESAEEEETDEMVEALENLILEAYSSMQSDGEYIFLPDEVAEKLHHIADQMGVEAERESGEILQRQDDVVTPSAGQDSGSGDAAMEDEETVELKLQQQDRPEPEQEQEQEVQQEKQEGTGEDDEARLNTMQTLQMEAAELPEEKQKQRIPRVVSTENLFTELAPVPEIDEEASSGTPSPALSRSHSGANTPNLRPRTPTRGQGHFPIISLTSTPSSVAASPDQVGKSPASRTPDQSGGSKQTARVPTYEKRREAARKMKEDKKKRELRIREDARKQREDAKRQLEKAHQKDMEEKRERVRRIREERLHRKAASKVTKKA
ncbi:Sodium/hydrogen exchanger 3 [Phytophthora boehmeriae]|uniref:Sodium/hydrogen exchanger 3 n=1 Tax=Phytophthora boehmeriae TaxID=109152 RepID=A0A8T1XDY8_9STRA|nr:Sodium/hydrogen exchanger 3 [Phytophthora boehmeriae]